MPMKKVPGSAKFPRAGKSFQTPVVKNKVGKNKKVTILGRSKVISMIKLLILLFVLAAATRASSQTQFKPDSTHAKDSIARLNAFVKSFNDSATVTNFQLWLYKNVTAQQYDEFSNTLQTYYGAYITERYNEFIKPKTTATSGKPKQ